MNRSLFSRGEVPAEATSVVSEELRATTLRVFALVGESITGATVALLSGDREMAKQIVKQDEEIDRLVKSLIRSVESLLMAAESPSLEDRKELLTLLRILPEIERNGDLAEHIARRAARGLGAEMSPRSRGLVERMGEVCSSIWRAATDAILDDRIDATSDIEDIDDEIDELHVALTAELVSGAMSVPVAVEVAMTARFYERFGDHCVNLARRRVSPSNN
ncbi:MAG: PhoU domain-containing protein [Actinomycetes bacterium]|jgi:phosphate transport system protein